MNTARIVVLTIAVGAGGVAAYLASGSDPKPVVTAAPVQQIETTDVLVARGDIAMGQTVTADDMQWQSWPSATASSNFIRRPDRGDAQAQLGGSIARSPFLAGEPIRETKLVKGSGSGFMAAILPTGMRAVSTEISPETGAGGFILPNDKVDVILTKREKKADKSGTNDVVNAEIILQNIRVLAIDQTVEEKNGQKVVVGKTATLELAPSQAETLALSQQLGSLSLALRSITDSARDDPQTDDKPAGRRSGVNIIRFGVGTMTSPK